MRNRVEVITFKKFPGMKFYDYLFKTWEGCLKEIDKLEVGDLIAIGRPNNIYLKGRGAVGKTRLQYMKTFRKSNRLYEDYIKDQLSCQYFFIIQDGKPQDIL